MSAEPTIQPDVYRRVTGRFVTGVTMVAALDDGRPARITAGPLGSVWLESPPDTPEA